MSKDIIVLTPNGRRQKVKCNPDTSILQILEDACAKQGFQASDFDLKHHNNLLDLTLTVRFANLPNKATLEMVEAGQKRKESIVTIGLTLEDGDRRTADFSPSVSLYDVILALAAAELQTLQNPAIVYMRQEVVGISSLKTKTLRQLGLLSGRAILRLLNKSDEATQANVSAVYRIPISDKHNHQEESLQTSNAVPSSSHVSNYPGEGYKFSDNKTLDVITAIKNEKKSALDEKIICDDEDDKSIKKVSEKSGSDKDQLKSGVHAVNESQNISSQENLERRLKIEEEVTFVGDRKAIAFTQPDGNQSEYEDLPDDFYDLTIEEVRNLYRDLQQQRVQLENTPLLTATKRQDIEKKVSEVKVNTYKNAVVRVQFPDNVILQGVFNPTDTIEDVIHFIKEHLQTPDKPFHVFTTPLKECLDPKMTLVEAKFVPCVHMHFKWADESGAPHLKRDLYTRQTSSDAASILASKYRAPCRRKNDEAVASTSSNNPSSSKSSKMPKWFKK